MSGFSLAATLFADKYAEVLAPGARVEVPFGWTSIVDVCLSDIQALSAGSDAKVHAVSSNGSIVHVLVGWGRIGPDAARSIAGAVQAAANLSRWSCHDCGRPGWREGDERQAVCRGHRLQARMQAEDAFQAVEDFGND